MRKKILLVLGLSIQLFVWADSAASPVQTKIMELEKEWAQAIATGDLSVIDRIESADIVSTAPDGTVTDKTQDMEDIRSHKLTAVSVDMEEVKVRVYGNTAVATGRLVLKGGKYGSTDISGAYRFTDTWLRSGNKWQAVATQATPIAKQ